MHTFLTRANALAAYTMSVLAGLTMVCFLSTFFLDYRTGSKINTVKVVVKHVPDYSASREKVRFLQKNCQDSSLGERAFFSLAILYLFKPMSFNFFTEWLRVPNIWSSSWLNTTFQLECKATVPLPYCRIWNSSQRSKPSCIMGQNHSKRRKCGIRLQVGI